MSLVQLYIPAETAQAVVNELGEVGLVQFRDMNAGISAFQQLFTQEIRRLDEMERKIHTLLEEASKEDVAVQAWAGSTAKRGITGASETEELSSQLSEYEQRVKQMAHHQTELETRLAQLMERQSVLRAAGAFLQEETKIGLEPPNDDSVDTVLGGGDLELAKPGPEPSGVGFVTGTIARRKIEAFERVMWRAIRGNVLVRSSDIVCLGDELKSAFVVFVHGQETLRRVQKICEALGCGLFKVDGEEGARGLALTEVTAAIDDIQAILFSTRQAKRAELAKVAEFLEPWRTQIRRQKAVFDTMNRFGCEGDAAMRKGFVCEGWCPAAEIPRLEAALRAAAEREGLAVAPLVTVLDPPANSVVPTHFPTNKFTLAFQEMTDAYGVPSYGELNPTLFSIITFPFLFAVMFGDVGHGAIMFVFALWMVVGERRLSHLASSELLGLIYSGRYIILLMGIFSVFAGFIYNDIFSRNMAIFPSAFVLDPHGGPTVRPSPAYVYPFGIDPAWAHAANGLTFLNSYKMKQGILFGLLQMFFGLGLAVANSLHAGDWTTVWTVTVPQIAFMAALFGYLGALIVFKWIHAFDVSVLNLFINMVLGFGSVEGTPIYPGQRIVQTVLMTIAAICVPWMLLAKPLHHYFRLERIKAQGYSEPRHSSGESISSTQKKAQAEEDGHGFGDMMTHQAIHTVEFVLSSVSNTASYLRLWALSLAHAQLSDVLWLLIDKSVFTPFALIPMFAVWFVFTVFLMVVMEGLSAFLHALRLHWVEFNSKFFIGRGVKFEPFVL